MTRVLFGGLLALCSGCYTTHVVSRAELAALNGFSVARPAEAPEVLAGDHLDEATIPFVRTTAPTPRKYSLLTGSDAEFEFGTETELTFVPRQGAKRSRRFSSLSVTPETITGTTTTGEAFAVAPSDLERVEVSRYQRGKTIVLVAGLAGGGTVLVGFFIWGAIALLTPRYY